MNSTLNYPAHLGQTMMKEHIECWRLTYISSASIPGDDGDGGDDGDDSVISEDSSDGAPDQHQGDCKQYNSLKAQRQ
jgi:hypothetical protein